MNTEKEDKEISLKKTRKSDAVNVKAHTLQEGKQETRHKKKKRLC